MFRGGFQRAEVGVAIEGMDEGEYRGLIPWIGQVARLEIFTGYPVSHIVGHAVFFPGAQGKWCGVQPFERDGEPPLSNVDQAAMIVSPVCVFVFGGD